MHATAMTRNYIFVYATPDQFPVMRLTNKYHKTIYCRNRFSPVCFFYPLALTRTYVLFSSRSPHTPSQAIFCIRIPVVAVFIHLFTRFLIKVIWPVARGEHSQLNDAVCHKHTHTHAHIWNEWDQPSKSIFSSINKAW